MVIKAIIFDVGGVLALNKYPEEIYRGHAHNMSIHGFMAKKIGISIDQWFDSIDPIYSYAIEGKISEEKFIYVLSKKLKISKKKFTKLYTKAYKKFFSQNKHLFKQAFKIKKRGYKIAVLSDQHYISKKAIMPEKFYRKFNPVVVSCDVGIRKPNSKIYKLILEKLKLKPSETLFIDNQEWNIKPAKKIGMKTILYKNNKQLFNDLRRLGILEGAESSLNKQLDKVLK